MEWIGWTVFCLFNPMALTVYYILWKQNDIEKALWGSKEDEEI